MRIDFDKTSELQIFKSLLDNFMSSAGELEDDEYFLIKEIRKKMRVAKAVELND